MPVTQSEEEANLSLDVEQRVKAPPQHSIPHTSDCKLLHSRPLTNTTRSNL